MNALLLLSDVIWDWKILSWPVMLGALALLWHSRGETYPFVSAAAPFVRYGLMVAAAASMLLFWMQFLSAGKGQDRLAHVPLGLSLLPLWVAGLISAFLVPKAQ